MLKSILNLEGAQGLTKNEQKIISGGFGPTPVPAECSFTSSTHWCYMGQGTFVNGKCCVFH